MGNGDRTKICPKCGKVYSEYPALSRADNKTFICPDCGVREALADAGLNKEKQEEIMKLVHANRNDGNE